VLAGVQSTNGWNCLARGRCLKAINLTLNLRDDIDALVLVKIDLIKQKRIMRNLKNKMISKLITISYNFNKTENDTVTRDLKN
jgi:hypothetical protein